MPELDELIPVVNEMVEVLERRAKRRRELEQYRSRVCVIPEAVQRAKVTKAYGMLMPMSAASYGRLIVNAATDRMEVSGIRTGDTDTDERIWNIWQHNGGDSEARLAIDEAVTHGRAFAIVWPNAETGIPTITYETAETVVVRYAEGSRTRRECALRCWKEGDDTYATLIRLDGVFHLRQGDKAGTWEPRNDPATGQWNNDPIKDADGNPIINVAELATNRRLELGQYGGHSEGDYENSTALIDRINTLEFLRLVIAFTAGFPVRVVTGGSPRFEPGTPVTDSNGNPIIGEDGTVLRNDDGAPIAPFQLTVDVIGQIEDPAAKIHELAAADIKSFGEAIDHDIETLAGTTQTPAYFLRSVPLQNIAAETIRAADTPLAARTNAHKMHMGEGFEEVLRIAGTLAGKEAGGPIDVPATAEIEWATREFRSLGERADAFLKLTQSQAIPWQAAAELCLDATQEQIRRWEAGAQVNGFAALLGKPGTELQPIA